MESTSDIAESLAEVARARRAGWAPRPTPRWYWWSVGLLSCAWVAASGARFVVGGIASVIFIIGSGVADRKRWLDFRPRIQGMPWPLRNAWTQPMGLRLGLTAGLYALASQIDLLPLRLALGLGALATVVVLGPRSDMLYAGAYRRWAAAQDLPA